MKANFQITLPSIPGKSIKFKIQDIKSAAFGIQKARFPQNKAMLTKKFVQSFHNFHQTKRDDEISTQAESQNTKSRVSQKKQLEYRHIVSQNKKFLIPIYTQLQREQKQKIQNTIIQAPIKSSGYSFSKAGLNQSYTQDQSNQKNYRSQNSVLTDNYYFTKESTDSKNQQKSKNIIPSAVFKNQTRKKYQDRVYSSIVPGSGAYLLDKPKIKEKRTKKSQSVDQNSFTDQKYLKGLITKVLQQKQQHIGQNEEQYVKQVKPNAIFMQDDRDRFGNQVFPIAPKLKVPGPGFYQTNDSMEDKVKKLVLVEQQRKLLKQWFNN